MKLNQLPLSIIATACTLALTACSSGGSSSPVENKIVPKEVQSVDKLAEKEKALSAKQVTLDQESKKLEAERKQLESKKLEYAKLAEKENVLNAQQKRLEAQAKKLSEERKTLDANKVEQSQLANKEKSLKAEQEALEKDKAQLAKDLDALARKQREQSETLNNKESALASKQNALDKENIELAKMRKALETATLAQEDKAKSVNSRLEQQTQALLTKQQALEEKEQALIKSSEDLKQQVATLADQQAQFNKMSEAQKSEFEANKKALADQKRALDVDIQALAIEKAKLAEEKTALVKAKAQLAEEKAQFDIEKNKPDPVALNKIEVKKGFEPNGTFTKTYKISTTNIFDEIEETSYTHDFNYVSGKLLESEAGVLTHKPVESEQKELNELMLDGKKVVLYSPEQIVEYKKNYLDDPEVKDLMVEGQKLGKVGSLPKDRNSKGFAQMRYGYVQQDNKTVLFVQGHLTPESEEGRSPYEHFFYGHNNPKGEAGEILKPMPKEGVFAYSGFAFMGKDATYKEYKAEGIADFANKKIKVDVKNADDVALTLGGKISGNTFEGTYQGAVTKGAFYGTEARDAGGTFYQTEGKFKDHSGVFGVTKSNCGFRKCREVEDKAALNNFSPEE